MKTKTAFNSRTKNILVIILSALMLLSAGLGFGGLLGKSDIASAATYDFRMSNESLEKFYVSHWANGQGSRVSGETNGKWYVGYGDINESGTKSFTQLPNFNSGNRGYDGNASHSYYWSITLSTRLYSNANTQTMIKFVAEDDATVVFSGLISKASSNKESLAGTQNGVDSIWLAGVNWSNEEYNWVNKQEYEIGMYKYTASNGSVTKIKSTYYNSEFVWLIPQNSITVAAGDEIYFTYKCLNKGDASNEYGTQALALFSSQATEYFEPTTPVDPEEPETPTDTRPENIPDVNVTSGFQKVAHYKFDDASDLGKNSASTGSDYDLTNSGLTIDGTLGGVKLSGTNFMYAPGITKSEADFSDAIKGNFSISFKAYAKLGPSDGRHYILSTGLDDSEKEIFAVSWEGTDLVVIAGGEEYRIDKAKADLDGNGEKDLYMLDETASWYRYTIIYNESDEENIKLTIRVDRMTNGMYGNYTVNTQKTLLSKVSFGGSEYYGFAIGAQSKLGSYEEGYATGSASFSPNIADLRIYAGIVDDAEILQIWKDDEGSNWYDRSGTYEMTIQNNQNAGTITGVANGAQYGLGHKVTVNIQAYNQKGYNVSKILWNDEEIAFTDNGGGSVSFERTIGKEGHDKTFGAITLKVNYTRTQHNIEVWENGVKNETLSGLYYEDTDASAYVFTVTAASGSKIDTVKLNGEDITRKLDDNNVYRCAVTEDLKFEITYAKPQYNLKFQIATTETATAKPSYKANTEVYPNKRYDANETVTVKLTAPDGCEIKAITWGNQEIDLTKNSDGVKLTKDGEYVTKIEIVKVLDTNVTVKVHYNKVGEVSEDLEIAGCESGIRSIEFGAGLVVLAGALLVIKKSKKSAK